MSIKSFLKERKISITSLASDTGIPYSTLNDIVNGKTDIQMVRLGIVQKICHALSLSIDAFLKLCADESSGIRIPDAEVIRKNKTYYLRYESGEILHEIRLCKINALNAEYISYMAEETMKNIRDQELLEAWS